MFPAYLPGPLLLPFVVTNVSSPAFVVSLIRRDTRYYHSEQQNGWTRTKTVTVDNNVNSDN